MTEAEWSESESPSDMLNFVRGRISKRKLRLFAAGCCRSVWTWVPPYSRIVVEVAERHADGQATRGQLISAIEEAQRDAVALGYWGCDMACACNAANESAWLGATLAASSAAGVEYLATVVVARESESFGVASEVQPLSGAELRRNEQKRQCQLLRDIVGNPFHGGFDVDVDVFRATETATAIARKIYSEMCFELMPILGDALEDASCANTMAIDHCRQNLVHVRGCWVVDLILGKR